FTYGRQAYIAWLSQDVLHQTRTNLFRAYARAEYGLFDKLSTGHMANLLTTETQRAGGYFSALFALIANMIVIAGYMLVLFWLSVSMTFFATILLVIGGLAVSYFIRRTKRLSRQTTTSNEDFSFLLIERLTAIRLLKLSAASRRESGNVGEASARVRDNMYGMAKLNARIDLLLEPFVVAAGVFILFSAVTVFNMSLPQIGLFMLVLLRLLPLCKELLRSRQSVMASIGGIEAVRFGLDLAVRAREPEAGRGRSFEGLSRGIAFQEVGFTYPEKAEAALLDISLTIPAGKITALVGPSGAGKSTLADLLPRLREPGTGTILFDGVEAAGYSLQSLRRGMAFVSQDTSILNDTVRANVAFARPEADEAEVRQALLKARALEFVESLPQGLETVLGERGAKLSGGQRQRISLARALLQKASILVLDEPTSALDSETERDIQAAINDLRKTGETTIIIIAHRLSTIREADQIVVLSNGRIVEQGTHKELLVSEDWYARVSGMQSARRA
ncbi:MAG: ABC transporter ATP-binding protein, partial [Thermodesulfobacteriota bacterium]|nr:ABC transporter ATP-binding protein [Thermodesulfobacteriota bacterium]